MAGYILVYLTIYMVMQIVVSVFFTIALEVRGILSGKSSVFVQNQVESIISQSTSQILLVSIILSLVAYVIMLSIEKRNLFKECSFKIISIKQFSMVLLVALGLSMFIDGVLSILPVDKWFPSHEQVINSITAGKSFTLTFLTVGIIGPIFEEILLRGLVFNELRKNMNLILAIILQALIFGVYHGNMLQFIYASILGVFLGIVYAWTNSLWSSIIVHLCFNSSSLILSKLSVNVNIIIYTFVGLVIFAVGIRYLHKQTHSSVQISNL